MKGARKVIVEKGSDERANTVALQAVGDEKYAFEDCGQISGRINALVT